MSTRAVKKVMVQNAIDEIALLRKGEIDSANKLLQARITCMDKLWVVETYGNDPQYQEMVNYLWEEVKELTLLLTDPTEKAGILCLGSPPVIDDDSEPVCPTDPPVVKYNLTLDVEYIGNTGAADGLTGSFTLDGTTVTFDDYTKEYNETHPLEVASYSLNFNGTTYRKNGVAVASNLYYKYNEVDPWTLEPSKIVPVNIVDQDVNVFVKFEEVPAPTEYDVDVSLSYLPGPGGSGADDGLSGSFDLNAITETLADFTKNALFSYSLGITTHTLDFSNTLYMMDGVSQAYLVQYRTSLSDPWTDAPTGSFTFDVVDQDLTVYVQFAYIPPSEYDLNLQIEWNYTSGPTNGFDGSYDIEAANYPVTKYDEIIVATHSLLNKQSHNVDLANLLCLIDDVSSPFTVDYRYDAGDPWLSLGDKDIQIYINGGDVNLFLRCTPTPAPTQYNLNLNLQYLGDSGAGNGIDGSYLVDAATVSIPSIVETVSNVHALSIASHTLDFTNINYNIGSVPANWDAQYSVDGGAFAPVVGNVINFDITNADKSITVQFSKQPLPALNMDFTLLYNNESGAGNGLTGTFNVETIGDITITPDYTTQFETTQGPLAAGDYIVNVANVAANLGTLPQAATAEYQIDGGGWNPVVGDQFTVTQDGVSVKDVEIRFTITQTTFDITVELVYEGNPGATDGLGGSYSLSGVPKTISLYTKTQIDTESALAIGNHTLDFINTLYYEAGISYPFEISYSVNGGLEQIVVGKSFDVEIVNQNLYVVVTASLGG